MVVTAMVLEYITTSHAYCQRKFVIEDIKWEQFMCRRGARKAFNVYQLSHSSEQDLAEPSASLSFVY
jgi:hypothetical protein